MSARLFGIFVVLVAALGAATVYFAVYNPDALPPEVASVLDRLPDRRVEAFREQRGEELVLPTFDIVRVDASGTAVIAGRGAPGASVVLRANGKPEAQEQISPEGEWATYVMAPFSEGAVELSLEMIMPGGKVIRGEQVIVIAVPERPGEKPLVVLGAPGAPSRVLQNPNDGDDTLILTLDTVDYDAEGTVVLAGRSAEKAGVRVYANGDLLGETVASKKGHWMLKPEAPIRPGIYTLRIDQLDNVGKVIMRIELPFERAEPADVLETVARGGGRVVVQPGNSLWRIARRIYGSGFEFTIIYDANRSQIRDPDWIYAGQILDLPIKREVDGEIHLTQ
jgi:nucleoid-associated protein YgaU